MMPAEVKGAVLLILAEAGACIARQLWRRLRFRIAMAPGVVTAHRAEALEVPLRGRERELEQLEAAVSRSRVLVVGGWAGVGKTTLGRALAQELARTQTPIWVDCKKGMGLESLINALANFFGDADQSYAHILKENLAKSPDLAVAALVGALDWGDNVLFLDDFHDIKDRHVTYDFVKALRLTAQRARAVLLVREAGRLRHALASEHAQVTYAEKLVLEDLDRSSSLELLQDRGLLGWPEEELGRLYKRTRGHPQGLELCAGLLADGMPIEEIEALPLFQRSGDEERSLRRVLRETERRLSRTQLHLLRRCSVFDEPFDEQAMAAVCPIEGCTEVAKEVQERFLLSRRNDRYGLHPLVREYFYDGLRGEAAFAHGLAGGYYMAEAKAAVSDSERLTAELKAHRHFELAHDYAQLLELSGAVFDHLETVCLWSEAWRICNLGLDASRRLRDRRRESRFLRGLGIICNNRGEQARAIEYHQQALTISRREGDLRGEGRHLGDLGNAHADLGQPDVAIQYYDQSLTISVEAGDRKSQGWTFGNLGLAYTNLKQSEKALGYYEEALVIARETGDRRAEVNHLNNLGMTYAGLGTPDKAIQYYKESLDLARALGDPRGEANALGNLGVVYAELGREVRAMLYYQRAVDIARRIGHGRGECHNLNNLGEAWRQRGKDERALACFLLAVQVGQDVSDPGVTTAEHNLALLKEELGQERFAALLRTVEPRKEQIVKRGLYIIARLARKTCDNKTTTGGLLFPEN